MSWVDLLILGIAVLAIVDGIRRGLLTQLFELVGFSAALTLALLYFRPLAELFVSRYHAPVLAAKPVAFLVIWLLVEVILTVVFHVIIRFIPQAYRASWWNRFAGVVPAVLKTGAIVGIVTTIILSLPIASGLKEPISSSASAQQLVRWSGGLTRFIERTLGAPFSDTFNFVTTPNGHDATSVTIPKIPDAARLKPEPTLETQMLDLINRERAAAGLTPLVADPDAQIVARAHSRDMWLRGYFSHVNPDGHDPFDRMKAAGLTYETAGENLALAPSLTIAHEGLMRSPGHRANILEPAFGRIGIGVISAGAEGYMFTQNFRD